MVLDTIRANPMLYVNILYKRLVALLESVTRIRIRWGSTGVLIPLSPWFIPVAIALGVMVRRLEYLKLLLFVAPTALVLVLFSLPAPQRNDIPTGHEVF